MSYEAEQERLLLQLMSRSWEAPRFGVTPGGGWGEWIVESRTRPGTEHEVHLAALPVGQAFNGECSCEDFTARCRVNLERHGQIRPHYHGTETRTQCKHIARAQHEALRQYLWRGLYQAHDPAEIRRKQSEADAASRVG